MGWYNAGPPGVLIRSESFCLDGRQGREVTMESENEEWEGDWTMIEGAASH